MSSQADHTDVASLLQQISAAGTAFTNQEASARERLLSLTYKLATNLELPSESVMRMMWAEPSRTAVCKVAIDLKLFTVLRDSGSRGISDGELAKASGASPTLVTRIMKHLAAMNIIQEAQPSHYIATTLSNSLTELRYSDGFSYLFEVASPAFQAFPAYLKKTSYRNPTELTNGTFQFVHNNKLPFFEWLQENPEQGSRFNNYMAVYRTGRPNWIDPGFFPVAERLPSTFNSEISPVMLVDIGGGLGHDLMELKRQHPDLPGELILQDLASVVSTAKESNAGLAPFKAMVHDFFEPQPIKNARIYHFHSSLHGWGDEDCVKILSNTAAAMSPGYSSVLIFEMVVPALSAPWTVTSEDFLLAVLGSMHERTLVEWENILHRAGLKICKIWSVEMGSESLIEAELA